MPLRLPHAFTAFEGLICSKHVRVAMLGEYGLTWPWESLHVEALAWFDQWLKDQDTGVLGGPRFRYILPGAEGWRTSETWPIPGTVHWSLALRAWGSLANDEAEPGFRQLMTLGVGLNRPRASETDLPSNLTWSTEPLPKAIDVIGEIELQLDATSTALDTAWIIILQDIATDNNVTNITAGYLRAGLRAVNDQTSPLGAPDLPCRIFQAVPGGEVVRYRILLVPNARRFNAGHRTRLLIASDDQDSQLPALSRHRRYELS